MFEQLYKLLKRFLFYVFIENRDVVREKKVKENYRIQFLQLNRGKFGDCKIYNFWLKEKLDLFLENMFLSSLRKVGC